MSKFCFLLLLLPSIASEKTSLFTGSDPSIRFTIRGNAGNVILKSCTEQEGYVLTDYQRGSGFVAFDRKTQEVTAEFKKKFSLNHLSKTVRKEAPKMDIFIAKETVVEFDLKLNDLGLGQFDFTDIHLRQFHLDASFGEVYIDFPTLNKTIVRDEVSIHLTAGRLDIGDLANLKAKEWNINGGAGELNLDIGSKLLNFTSVKLDLDIGVLKLTIPSGTKVEIHGTNRDLNDFGFVPTKNGWISDSYHQASPLLSIYLLGPLGELQITWK